MSVLFKSIVYHLVVYVVSSPLLISSQVKKAENVFLEPTAISAYEDIVYDEKNKLQFIFVNKELNMAQAQMHCATILDGTLAVIKTQEIADFLGEAMFEVDHNLDNMWLGATRKAPAGSTEEPQWFWDTFDDEGILRQEPIVDAVKDLMIKRHNASDGTTRNCLTFTRTSHVYPLLVDLYCATLRPFICQRTYVQPPAEDHGSPWFPYKDRVYKIFSDKRTWKNATYRCFKEDPTAILATIAEGRLMTILTRYMLIGRPSLEYAWIGGKYENKWIYPQDNGLEIPSQGELDEDDFIFPPWTGEDDKPIKNAGCILLDRHVSNESRFIEAACNSLRPFICSKPINLGHDRFSNDFSTDISDYRLYYDLTTWYVAKEKCLKLKGKLAEPEGELEEAVKLYLFIMGENRTALQHLWLGAYYNMTENKWHLNSSPGDVLDLGRFAVGNITYIAHLEDLNLCLNIDRENHDSALLYGTDCTFGQAYLCQWAKGERPPLPGSTSEKTEMVEGTTKVIEDITEITEGTTEENVS